jgi:hypothetical protein
MDQEFKNTFRSRASFQHKFERLSKLKANKEDFSPIVRVRNLPWRIKIILSLMEDTKHLSIYLSGDGNGKIKWSCDVKFIIKLWNHKDPKKSISTNYSHCFTGRSHCYGSFNFIAFDKLVDVKNGFLVNDSILIEIELTAGVPNNDAISVENLYETLDAKGELLEKTHKELKAYKNVSYLLDFFLLH